jgi:hypothetical protein
MSAAASRRGLLGWGLLGWLGLGLGGCAGWAGPRFPQSQPLGSSRADMLARLGRPASYPLPQGERLQYSFCRPATRSTTWTWTPAAAGARRPALTRARIDADLQLDQSRAEDIRRLYGEPVRLDRVARFDGDVWVYRFLDMNEPFYAFLHLDPQGVVRRVVYRRSTTCPPGATMDESAAAEPLNA